MENLLFIDNERLLSENLIRIGDIINFEGPIMTLFQDVQYNDLYIFDWVDRDETTNRWLIYQVDPSMLYKFLKKNISHIDLFNSIKNRPVYITDIRHGSTLQNNPITRIQEMPVNYYPELMFFEEEDSVNLENIKKAVIKSASHPAKQNLFVYRSPDKKYILITEQKKEIQNLAFDTLNNIHQIVEHSFDAYQNYQTLSTYQDIIRKALLICTKEEDKKNTLDNIDKSTYAY